MTQGTMDLTEAGAALVEAQERQDAIELDESQRLEPRVPVFTDEVQVSSTPRPAGIMAKAVCLLVELRRLGNSRRTPSGSVVTDADRDMFRVNKSLLDSPELKKIAQLDGEMRRYVASRCLPSMFKTGVYLLPNGLIEEVDARIEKFAVERAELVEDFCKVYDAQKSAAADKLKSMYNPADYAASAEEVRAAFSVRTQYVAFDTPGTLRDIKRAIFEREAGKAAAQWTEALAECRQVLRAELASLIDHALDRLTPGADGKPRVFRDSLIKNLDEFFSTFNARNSIGEDADLDALVAQARTILGGVSPDELRKSDAARSDVLSRLAQVKGQLDTMIVEKPSRGFMVEAE
jgi:hypothetical protein